MGKIKRSKLSLGLALSAYIAAAATQSSLALDARYRDADGDLVADVPANTVDPSSLVFSYTPGEDPALFPVVWDELLQHLQKATGKSAQFYPAQSNAAQLETMRAGRLHIAGISTGSVPIAVNCSGFAPFAAMANQHGIVGYQTEIIVAPDGGVDGLKDLKGRKIAFTSPTSNSGYKEPTVLLRDEWGFEAGRDYTSTFTGRHENSILGIVHRDYDAAAIASEVLQRLVARGVVTKDQFKTIYRSQVFPTAAFGHAHNLNAGLAARIRQAFFSFSWPGSKLEKEFSSIGASRFAAITYQADWAAVRKVDAAMQVNYGCK
jgi:phosphonate transport system substrate-binding protein